MNVFPGSRPAWFPLPRAWRAHAIDTAGSMLLETAGGLGSDHTSYLFTAPEKILRATSTAELAALLNDIDAAAQQGFFAAGHIDYEAAYALHNIPFNGLPRPIACFGLYREPLQFDHRSGVASGAALAPVREEKIDAEAVLSPPQLKIELGNYADKFAAVQRLLTAGDTYQVNLTTRAVAGLLVSPLALYEALIDAQPVDFAAILNFGESLMLSFPPNFSSAPNDLLHERESSHGL